MSTFRPDVRAKNCSQVDLPIPTNRNKRRQSRCGSEWDIWGRVRPPDPRTGRAGGSTDQMCALRSGYQESVARDSGRYPSAADKSEAAVMMSALA